MNDTVTTGSNKAWTDLRDSSKQAQQAATQKINQMAISEQQRQTFQDYQEHVQHMKQIMGLNSQYQQSKIQGMPGGSGGAGGRMLGNAQVSSPSVYGVSLATSAAMPTAQESIQHRETQDKKPKLKSYLEGLLDD